MDITFIPLDTAWVSAIRAGGPDIHGQPAERVISDGADTPCRHCLRDVPDGAAMLILAARPFPALQPYAEAGPIFLCADHCRAWDGPGVPPILGTSPDYLLKGYGPDNRIIYGTGRITPRAELTEYATMLLRDPAIAYVHVRSARNNCYQAKVVRAGGGADDPTEPRSDP
ncbi:MAG: DUF1203 domain-containing protein [Pseudomonadota bacterium]